MRAVFGSEEWIEVSGLKAQGRRKVNREVNVVGGLMHSLVTDGMSVLKNNRLLYTGSYVQCSCEQVGAGGEEER